MDKFKVAPLQGGGPNSPNRFATFKSTYTVVFHRTCWIYNLCGSIRIYKNQINIIDPYADL